MKRKQISSLFLVLLLLYGATPVLAKDDPTTVQWTEVKFTGGKAFMIYIFELSLLEIPIGIDNPPPWNPGNIEHDYFQDQVDRKKLEDLYDLIQERIRQDDSYSFVVLDELSDENKIILRHTVNHDIMFCYDGLIFWVEITFDEINLDSLLEHSSPSFETFFPDDWDSYVDHRNRLLRLLGDELLVKYLPRNPLGSSGDQNQSVTHDSAHWVIILEQPFSLHDELGNSYPCSWEDVCSDETCIDTVERFVDQINFYNFNSEMVFFSDETFIVIGNIELDSHAFRFNDMILLLNIKRTLHEFAPPLGDAYYNPPTSIFPYEATSNLNKLDRMAAFVSFAKYASYGLEKGPEADIPPFYQGADYLSKQLVEIHRFISIEEEDIRNHIARNEHALTKFAVFFAIFVVFISFFFSLIAGKRLKREFVKENIKNLEEIFFYLVPIFLALFTYVLLSRFSLFIDIMNARYMLSALIQSEAAVIAIVITMNLIGIQLGAAYSPRVARIFRDSLELKVLIFSYTISILYGLCILGIIKSDYMGHVIIAYSLGVFCFTVLISFVIKMLRTIEPSANIEKWSQEIRKEDILEGKIAIQRVMDIIKRSIRNSDEQTAEFGLEKIKDRIMDIFENEKFEGKEEEEMSEKVYSHFIKIGEFAMDKKDESSAGAVVKNIEEMGIEAVKKGHEAAAWKAAESLSDLGSTAIGNRLEKIAWGVACSLNNIGEVAIDCEFQKTSIIIKFLQAVRNVAASVQLKKIKSISEFWLENLKEIAREKGNDNLVSYIERSENQKGV